MIEHEEKVKSEQEAEKKQSEGKKWEPSTMNLKKTLNTAEIFSSSVTFLIAGYETTSNTLNLIAYNLAINPEYQEKVCEEIDRVLGNYVKMLYYYLKVLRE